jgi:hypothetical protein
VAASAREILGIEYFDENIAVLTGPARLAATKIRPLPSQPKPLTITSTTVWGNAVGQFSD